MAASASLAFACAAKADTTSAKVTEGNERPKSRLTLFVAQAMGSSGVRHFLGTWSDANDRADSALSLEVRFPNQSTRSGFDLER